MSVSASGMAAERPTMEQSRKAIYAATIGNVMEWYDFGVFGFLAGSLALNFFPSDDRGSSLGKKFSASDPARNPKTPKSYHSMTLPIVAA